MSGNDELKGLADRLRQDRDELILQLDLAKMEARDEWEELEGKWQDFTGKMKVVREEAADASGEVREAAKLLAEEVKEGYARIRKLM